MTAFDAEESVLCSPVCLGLVAKYEHYSSISMEIKRDSLQSRLDGGGRSLSLTILRENSLLTGKNTGNLAILRPKNSASFLLSRS
ncbi:MAG: hypothetical protein WB562_00685, partial [Candidatus Sulfotelmatobacter sp.]